MPEGNTDKGKKRKLGFCAFRPQPCSNRCQWFLQGMHCCVIHGLNQNLGNILKTLKEIQDEKKEED